MEKSISIGLPFAYIELFVSKRVTNWHVPTPNNGSLYSFAYQRLTRKNSCTSSPGMADTQRILQRNVNLVLFTQVAEWQEFDYNPRKRIS
mgnify:CR=1 FL=1